MRYYVIPKEDNAFTTEWFIIENTYCNDDIIIDTFTDMVYKGDSNGWQPIEEDNL